jgi:hypothetical protein
MIIIIHNTTIILGLINDTTTSIDDIMTNTNNTPTSTEGGLTSTPFSTTKSTFPLQSKKPIFFVVLAEYSDSNKTAICLVYNINFFTEDSKACLCNISKIDTLCLYWYQESKSVLNVYRTYTN